MNIQECIYIRRDVTRIIGIIFYMTGQGADQVSRSIPRNVNQFEEFIRQHERTCIERNQLERRLATKYREIEMLKSKLEALTCQVPPSHQVSTLEKKVSDNEADLIELRGIVKEVKLVLDDCGKTIRDSRIAITEESRLIGLPVLRQEIHKMHVQQEALPGQLAALERKLSTEIRLKDEEIKRLGIQLNIQRERLTLKHTAALEKQETHHKKMLREIEHRYSNMLMSAEMQFASELRDKNFKIAQLESKVKKLEAQLPATQPSMLKKLKRLLIRQKSAPSGAVQKRKKYGDESVRLSTHSSKRKSKHIAEKHDQTSYASTLSPDLYYDQCSLHSLPAIHLKEVQKHAFVSHEDAQDQSPVVSYKAEFNEGYLSEPEDDTIDLLGPYLSLNSSACAI